MNRMPAIQTVDPIFIDDITADYSFREGDGREAPCGATGPFPVRRCV